MKIDIEAIQRLREQTGVGLTDAKLALAEAKGDFDKALEAMRIKGLGRADKKASRSTSAGIVHSYVHGNKIGVLVEINCETDFVARTDDFKTLANDIALQIAASAPTYLAPDEVPDDVLSHEKKLLAAELKEQGKPVDMIEKIVQGKLEKYYSEVCLLRQPFVKDPEQTIEAIVKAAIAKLGENIVVRRFVRLALGED